MKTKFKCMLKLGIINRVEYLLLISSKKQQKRIYNLINKARQLRETSLLRRIYDLE